MQPTQFNQVSAFKVLYHSVKLPLVLLFIGLCLEAAPLLLTIWLPAWTYYLDLADIVGSTLVSLAYVIFIFTALLGLARNYQKSSREQHQHTMSHITSIFRNGLKIVFGLVVFNILLSGFELDKKYFDAAHHIVYVTIICSISWVILQIISLFESIAYRKYASKPVTADTKRAVALYTRIHILKNLAVIILVIITVAASLMVFDKVRSLGVSLLASAGVFTAIVALAAQKTLGSFFTGFQLVLTHPVEIGETVVVENELGTVEEITLSTVIVKVWDSRRLVLPVSYFMDRPFQNWSRSTDGLLSKTFFYVDYTFPIQALREELKTMITQIPGYNGRICKLMVTNCTAHEVELAVLISAENAGDLDNVRCDLRERVLAFINQNYPDSFPKYHLEKKTDPVASN